MKNPVKHIFYVHSHITYAIALAILEAKKIDLNHAIFLYPNRYQPRLNQAYKFIKSPAEFEKFSDFTFNFFKLTKQINNFKKWLQKNDIDTFKTYIPHKQIATVKLLIAQEGCLSYSFIEEGGASYIKNNLAHSIGSIKHKTKSMLYPWNKFGPSYFFDERYEYLFCAKEKAFFDLPRKYILNPKFDILFGIEDNNLESNSHVFALTPLLPLNKISNELGSAYTASLIESLNKTQGATIYYKLHPEQYRNDEEILFDKIFSEFKAIKLPEIFCIESLNNATKPINLHLFFSSIALYLDNPIIITHSALEKVQELAPNGIKKMLDRLPADFLEAMEFTINR